MPLTLLRGWDDQNDDCDDDGVGQAFAEEDGIDSSTQNDTTSPRPFPTPPPATTTMVVVVLPLAVPPTLKLVRAYPYLSLRSLVSTTASRSQCDLLARDPRP